MKRIIFSKLILSILLMTLTLSACSINLGPGTGSSSSNALDGGLFRSMNKGTNWQQKTAILTVGAKQSFAPLDIISLASDPQDNKAIYAGSAGNGLFYSYDGGESWQFARTLGKVSVANIAVDPNNKCILYATVANKVYKSIDCSRNWSVIYFDTALKVAITTLAVESGNSHNIYIGTSRGEIIKSSDQGDNWKTLYRFSGQVSKIMMSPADNKNIFAATAGGIFRSVDSGLNWVSLEDKLKDLKGGKAFRDWTMTKAAQPIIFLATKYGLLKSTDYGDSWSKIELITPTPKTAVIINAIAVNPLDANEIYYATDTTFYRSLDGGKTWNSMKLPTSRAGLKLLIDQKNPSIIYLTTRQLKK